MLSKTCLIRDGESDLQSEDQFKSNVGLIWQQIFVLLDFTRRIRMPLRTTWLKWIRNSLVAAFFGCAAMSVEAGDRHALLIGYNDYKSETGLQPLRYAAKDVSDLRATLLEMGYDADDIVVLNGKDGSPSPTAEKIRAALTKMEGAVADEPGSSLMIVFAGHGFNHEGESYLCPADYQQERPTESAIAVAEVSRILEGARADGRYLIIDACRNEVLSTGSAEFNLRTGLKKLRISDRKGAQGVVVLSSCVPGQQSWEIDEPAIHRSGSPQPNKNGVFMHFIMQGLRGAADVFDQTTGFDGIITATELHEYAARETFRFVNAEFDTVQNPWADVHATASLGIVTLNEEQRQKLGRVERRSAQSLLDQELAEQKTGDGVMLLVGGERELRPMATVRFSQAIELSPDLYMPRRLRALLNVLEGNNAQSRSADLYQSALNDMKAIGSPLRIAIPDDAQDLPIYGPSTELNGSKEYKALTKVSGGDVLEIEDLQVASNVSWLKVRRINRWLGDENTGAAQETLHGYIQLSKLARPEADKAQLRDINRLRKPTAEELRVMSRSRPVAMGQGNLQKAENAVQLAGKINSFAGGNPEVSKGLGYTTIALGLATDIQQMKQEKQQTGRVSIGSVRRAAGRFGVGW